MGLSDISRSIGPMIDLIFISQFIGINGVTVMGYVAPLIMLLGFIIKPQEDSRFFKREMNCAIKI